MKTVAFAILVTLVLIMAVSCNNGDEVTQILEPPVPGAELEDGVVIDKQTYGGMLERERVSFVRFIDRVASTTLPEVWAVCEEDQSYEFWVVRDSGRLEIVGVVGAEPEGEGPQ